MNDATWLAELAAHNLLAAASIPPAPIRRLRDLTRGRSALVHDRSPSQRMLGALVAGERNPHVFADFSIRRMRLNIPELVEALEGRFTEHHASMVTPSAAHRDAR